MSGILSFAGLRLVGTTKYIIKKNPKSYRGFMYHVRNSFSSTAKNSIPSTQKKSAGLWNTIKICSVGLSIIGLNTAIYYAYKIKADPKLREANRMRFAAVFENLKYSITPSKIITSSVLFDDSETEILTLDEIITFKNENTRNLIINEELEANIQKPFPRGEPIPVKIGKYTGSLDNGKLILKTEDGETTFTFDHEISFKVKKSSGTLQNEFTDSQKVSQRKVLSYKVGDFNVLVYGDKLSLISSEGEKKWFSDVHRISEPDESIPVVVPALGEIFPRAGSFIYSLCGVMKIQADNSDEVVLRQKFDTVIAEKDKKINISAQPNFIFEDMA